MSRSLATGSNLKRRHVIRDAVCRRCCNAEETEDHIFFECEYAKQIWRASGISNLTILNNLTSLEDKNGACLQICMSARLRHFQDLPLWILWRLWKGRNVLVFQQKHTHWMNIIRYTKSDAKEWKLIDDAEMNVVDRRNNITTVQTQGHWRRPPQGWIKCNTDGSFINEETLTTVGWIVRDSNGTYRGVAQAIGKRVQRPLESELQAILMALQHCWSISYRKVIMEIDCKTAKEILQDNKFHFPVYNWTKYIRE